MYFISQDHRVSGYGLALVKGYIKWWFDSRQRIPANPRTFQRNQKVRERYGVVFSRYPETDLRIKKDGCCGIGRAQQECFIATNTEPKKWQSRLPTICKGSPAAALAASLSFVCTQMMFSVVLVFSSAATHTHRVVRSHASG
ncbi:unnamed protein product, partial [Ectocarpus sp. 4 AP-2014]